MDEFEALVSAALNQPITGWDFRFLDNRMLDDTLPWSYADRATELVKASRLPVLDLGTGGGDFFASLAPLPAGSTATEGWPPNFGIARQRLAAHGVDVVEVGADGRLPLPTGRYGVVLDRHEAYDAHEVCRVLAPGGTFLNQQVLADDSQELNTALGAPPPQRRTDWGLGAAVAELAGTELTVTRAGQARGRRRFLDIGALVYYLRLLPWQVPDFDVETYADRLRDIHRQMARGRPLTCSVRRFCLEAVRR